MATTYSYEDQLVRFHLPSSLADFDKFTIHRHALTQTGVKVSDVFVESLGPGVTAEQLNERFLDRYFPVFTASAMFADRPASLGVNDFDGAKMALGFFSFSRVEVNSPVDAAPFLGWMIRFGSPVRKRVNGSAVQGPHELNPDGAYAVVYTASVSKGEVKTPLRARIYHTYSNDGGPLGFRDLALPFDSTQLPRPPGNVVEFGEGWRDPSRKDSPAPGPYSDPVVPNYGPTVQLPALPLANGVKEAPSMKGISFSKLYGRVFQGSPDLALRLVLPGHRTGRKVGFHRGAKPLLTGPWASMVDGVDGKPFTVHQAEMSRPVHFIRGRGGRVALLVLPHDWITSSLPASSPLFGWFDRPVPPWMASWILDRSARRPVDHMKWYLGDDLVASDAAPYASGTITYSTSPSNLTAALRSLYDSCALGQGLAVAHRVYGTHQVVAGRAAGGVGPGVYSSNWDVNAGVFSLSAPDPSKWLEAQAAYAWSQSGSDASASRVYSLTSPGHLHFVRDREPWVDLASALGVSPVVEVGFPYPMITSRIGYVTGFPTAGGPIMIELESFAPTDSGLDCSVSWSSIDYRGSDYKRLFPVATLPADKRALVEGRLGSLPDGLWFRSALVPGGVDYEPGQDYEGTRLARDVSKVGSTLGELLFDDPSDGKPPVPYDALGALSVREVKKGRNTMFTVVLAADQSSFVSVAEITFSRAERKVIATQEGTTISSGQAAVALRVGAPASFVAPLTNDEVAVDFFLLPNWLAVTGDPSTEGQARDYLVDENLNSNDLRFDLDSDERARGLPLLLGFSRFEFSNIAAPLSLGLTGGEL